MSFLHVLRHRFNVATADDLTAPQQFPVRIKTEGGVYNKPDVLSDNLRCPTCPVRLPAVR